MLGFFPPLSVSLSLSLSKNTLYARVFDLMIKLSEMKYHDVALIDEAQREMEIKCEGLIKGGLHAV